MVNRAKYAVPTRRYSKRQESTPYDADEYGNWQDDRGRSDVGHDDDNGMEFYLYGMALAHADTIKRS